MSQKRKMSKIFQFFDARNKKNLSVEWSVIREMFRVVYSKFTLIDCGVLIE
jgi:hypothetical protein